MEILKELSIKKIISIDLRWLWLVKEATSSTIFSASLRTGIKTVMGASIWGVDLGRRIEKKLSAVIESSRVENIKSAVDI